MVKLFTCKCIFCMKEFLSFHASAEICQECIESEKAFSEIIEGDDEY